MPPSGLVRNHTQWYLTYMSSGLQLAASCRTANCGVSSQTVASKDGVVWTSIEESLIHSLQRYSSI